MDARTLAAIKAQCFDLVVAFAECQDAGDGDALARLFSADGILDRPGSVIHGREGIRNHFLNRPRGLVMRNFVTNPVIRPTDDSHAEGQCSYVAFRHIDEQAGRDAPPRPLDRPAFIGDYISKFVLTREGWKIEYHKVQRIFENERFR